MWIVCITSVRHVLTVNGYGGRQTKENEKSQCFKGWETLVNYYFERQAPPDTIVAKIYNICELPKKKVIKDIYFYKMQKEQLLYEYDDRPLLTPQFVTEVT